jgi:hypothetical protein
MRGNYSPPILGEGTSTRLALISLLELSDGLSGVVNRGYASG